VIDDFGRGLKDWSSDPTKARGWSMTTRKLSDPRWVGPKGAELACEVSSVAPGNWLGVVIHRRFKGRNSGHAPYFAFIKLPQAGWNPVRLKPSDFTNVYGEVLDDWHKALSLTFGEGESVANEKKRLLPRAGDTSRMTANYLDEALTELLAGQPITTPKANPIGCNVKWDGQDAHWMPPEACDLV